MKLLNVNELKEQIADAHKKLAKKVDQEEYDVFVLKTNTELEDIMKKLADLQRKYKELEMTQFELTESLSSAYKRVSNFYHIITCELTLINMYRLTSLSPQSPN